MPGDSTLILDVQSLAYVLKVNGDNELKSINMQQKPTADKELSPAVNQSGPVV